tara:strand:- start:938 stop:1462 length:525 start_codon:yes stop_codon:yes gene_type:complete
MISKNIKPNKVNFPAVQGIGGPAFIGKVLLKNVYQPWRGENFIEITEKALGNPFNLRIGLPQMDKQLKEDRVFLFTKYLSYNPLTKQIEKRELIPLRNVEKVYIGHSPEEHEFHNYKLFVDGNIVVEDVLFKQPNQQIGSLVNKIQKLEEKIQYLEQQIQKHTTITEKQTIYNQ